MISFITYPFYCKAFKVVPTVYFMCSLHKVQLIEKIPTYNITLKHSEINRFHSHRLPGAVAWGGRFFVKTLWMIAPGNQGLDLSIFEERSKFSNKSQKQVFFLFKWQVKNSKT